MKHVRSVLHQLMEIQLFSNNLSHNTLIKNPSHSDSMSPPAAALFHFIKIEGM